MRTFIYSIFFFRKLSFFSNSLFYYLRCEYVSCSIYLIADSFFLVRLAFFLEFLEWLRVFPRLVTERKFSCSLEAPQQFYLRQGAFCEGAFFLIG